MKVSVVIPTYNEAENIGDVVKEVFKVLEGLDCEILVVDDGSPDGTAEIIKELKEDYQNLKLLEREGKSGLGSAYKDGFSRVEGDRIVQMDADFSHPIEKIPEMVDMLEEGDVVVGSRYVSGGGRDDPWYRQILPLLGSLGYRSLVGSPVKDVTSGFKAYREECLDTLTGEDLPNGFDFQPGSLMRLVWRGFSVTEMPIKFESRRAGNPKFSWKETFDNIVLMVRLVFARFSRSYR